MGGAEKILSENMDILHKLSIELLEREILDSEEINAIIKGEELPPIPENGKDKQETQKESKEEIPDHVQKMMEERKNKDTSTQDDSH
jgi:cell division protease FtsH